METENIPITCNCGAIFKHKNSSRHISRSGRHHKWVISGSIRGESKSMFTYIYSESIRIGIPVIILRDLMAELDKYSHWFMLLNYSIPLHTISINPVNDTKRYLTGVVYDFMTILYNEVLFFELPISLQNKINIANSMRENSLYLNSETNSNDKYELRLSQLNYQYVMPIMDTSNWRLESIIIDIIDVDTQLDDTNDIEQQSEIKLVQMPSFPSSVLLTHHRDECKSKSEELMCGVCLKLESEIILELNNMIVLSCGHYLCHTCTTNITDTICPICRQDTIVR